MKISPIIITFLAAAAAAGAAAENYTVLSDGVAVKAGGTNVRLQVCGDKLIRVSATPKNDFKRDSSLVVVPQTAGKFQVTPDGRDVLLTTAEVKAVVNGTTGTVTFFDRHGKKILQEESREFTPINVEGTDGFTVMQTFASLDDNEGIYGLGQHQSNEFNYKGKNEELFQYNTKVSVPFVVSTDNYGILWDSYSLCRWGNPADYSQLGEVFTLYNKDGKKGSLTGTYKGADGKVIVREEKAINFDHLVSHTLDHVVNVPEGFKFAGSNVVFEGEIEPAQTGDYEFNLYYSGYQTVEIDGKTVVPERWRSPWNPNSYKFSVYLTKGRRVPIRLEWNSGGGEAYCGLRAYAPRSEEQRRQMSWWGEMQDMIDYYFIYGDNIDDVISGYRTLTGKASIMPKWAMGFWQSREKYNTQEEVLSTLTEFRKRHIPIDNIVIDWLHWPQDSWGCHEFDPARFPDPKKMVDSIHALDARVMVSVWPKFYATTEHFKEFDSKGWMYRQAIVDSIRDWVGPGYLGSFYDAYNPEARKLFWSQMKDHYVPLGIDAWWMDASEPNIRDCTEIGYRKQLCGPTYLGPSTKYFNAYGLVNADAIYNGQRGMDPDRRVFLLTRSGFAGQQRYSTVTWSGDIATRWEDMEAQISAGLNFAVSGIPVWSMDIGGFTVEDRYVAAQQLFNETGVENDDLKEWRELNARWYQFGVFTPMYRAHGQWPFREVFNIAPEDHPAYKTIVDYTRMRYALMPYIYSLTGMTYFKDYTIMRPMVMDFTADLNTRNLKDQYMFGPAIMAAPVYEYGARSRRVYFPEGEDWYDYYTGSVIAAGRSATVDAPYDRIPLFVRAGSIIPLGGEIENTVKDSDEPITLMVYGGRDGSFTLYNDEGVNYNYEKGLCSTIELSYDDKANTLTIGARKGSYEGMPEKLKFNVVKVDAAHPAACAHAAAGKTVDYDGAEIAIAL